MLQLRSFFHPLPLWLSIIYTLRPTHLTELDRRFAILAPGQYIPYDLDGPNNFPVELRQYFGCDLVVVNLPLLNEVSFRSGGPYH